MNIYDWNRKDCEPENTVDTIKKILDSNGLFTTIVDQKNYHDYWSSARVEFESLPGWGANGKGINTAYTLASAYGELIERLQAGVLIEPLFASKEHKPERKYDITKSISIIRKFFYNESEKYTDEQLKNMLSVYPEMNSCSRFLDVESGEEVEITDRFLGFICGTNGIAAGNTLEEAFCQGLCEIFERFVMKQIYKENTPYNWPTISRESYCNTKSMNLINEIEKKGYTCIIKDCTLNGLLPVVGVLLLDSSKTKYVFRLGSDINFDIALQRCITEVFQGISFDITFRMQMQSIFSNTNDSSIWNYMNPAEGVARSITTGMGIIPYFMFNNYITHSIEPFRNDILTNKESLVLLVKIFKKLGKKLYVKDCSYLGFPTIHIFVPEISNAYYYDNNMDYLPVLEAIGKLHYVNNTNNVLSEKEQLEILQTISNYSTFKYNTTLNKFTGITLTKVDENEVDNLHYAIGMLALSIGNYDLANQFLSSAYKYESEIRNKTYDYISLIIEGMEKGYSNEKVINLLKAIDAPSDIFELNKKLHRVQKEKYNVFNCSNCDECKYNDACSFPYWKSVMDTLYNKKQLYYSSNVYNSYFYQMLNALIKK